MRARCALYCTCLGALLPATALADGAFPEAAALFAPADRPDEIYVGTNFGLVLTRDGGATWHVVCEPAIGPYAALFQLGPAPGHAIYASTSAGVARSDDACAWTRSSGRLADAAVADAFPDPTDGARVLAIGTPALDGAVAPQGLYESRDGARSFPAAPLYQASADEILDGVEVSRAAPATIYLTGYRLQPGGAVQPEVLRSSDAGATWQARDLTPSLGPRVIRLAGVDPELATRLYLRVSGQAGDQLAISDDGGATARIALQLDNGEALAAFLRRADGTLLAAGRNGLLFRSTDGGVHFTAQPDAPHVRGLAERAGQVFAAGDDGADGFAVSRQRDDGTWQPLLAYRDLCGVLECAAIASTCAQPWAATAALLGVPPRDCRPRDAAVDAPPVDGGVTPARPGGCGCSIGASARAPLWPALASLALLLARRARRRRFDHG